MSPGDFFTLTEMNDGLTTPSRVRELVAVMQKDRDCIMNVDDATKQWSAVARTLAATENKDCLDLFVQLDGLQFIDIWLKDAQKFSSESGESFMEESISHLLRALEKLHVDNEKLVSSKICTTVKDLLGHNSSKVLDRARALLDSWEKDRVSNASSVTTERIGPSADNDTRLADIEKDSRHSESSFGGALIPRDNAGEEKCQQSTKNHPMPPTSLNALEPDHVESAQTFDRILDHPVVNDRTSDLVDFPSSSKSANENGFIKVEPLACHPVGTASVDSCSPAVARQGFHDEETDLNELESAHDIMQTKQNESSPEKVCLSDEFKLLGDQPFSSTSEAADASSSAIESSLLKLSGSMEKVSCQKSSSSVDVRPTDSEGKDAVDDGECSLQCRSPSAQRTEENAEIDTVLQNSSTSEQSWENSKNSSAFSLKIEDEGGINKIDQLDIDGSDDARAKDYDFGKNIGRREPDMTNKKSIVESDYEILDPLEVARQVAIEVERELVDYREQSCSSSEKAPEGKLQVPDRPDFLSKKGSHASKGSPEVAHYPDLSTEASLMLEESATSSENLDAEPINDAQDVETSQVTEVAQEEANMARGLCNIDLNQVHSEDTDPPVNQISTAVSIFSASRATAAPGLPVAPFQFEGKFGWRGSATTRVFRPASPRRMPEGDKDLSTGESSSSSKQRHGCLDIDLNIAESEDGRIGDLPDKQVPVSSTLLSVESSVEANSRSERLELDLNRASDDGDVPSDWKINGQIFPKRNGNQSQTLSPSSSLKQSSLRNIDLNDQPSFLNDYSDHSHLTKSPQNLNASGDLKSDESVISIMGTRVVVKRRDFVPHTLPLPNGRTPELEFDVNLARTSSFLGMGSAPPYAPSTLYKYNGISPSNAMPFPTLYGTAGPIPYMVDSRGTPVVPQIVGSASALPPAFSQPPFLISMTSSTLSNGVLPSQGSFDLDSRLLLEGGSRGPTGLGLLSNSASFRSTDEQLRYYPQPSISSVGEKRKEPDVGWEYYPFKHYTPPWKQR
ncbi:uncharacterized protein LOC111392167 [Olea europaea var. sylvestris]|uniref:Dentin sialophospho n=1 Tax=Olea europaea subsp. europaea TaxID=158383 RepID=A0A8S0VEF7_OLEEU|nr:uncharacterized protein LOC111392167 [Olea europaea var. sylvestris]XP_022873203.1 uncharacterized protein LOC111392167 [Olea europaea var. sylvestris]CAA3029267.1 dentin sialophospho [Olea europaea subsp. europaea]